jgi:hypothetical protein
MLASITPLGERGRGTRWRVTVLLFVAGSAAAGIALGGLLGLAGAAAGIARVGMGERVLILVAATVAGVAVESGAFGLKLPSPRRQVNEEWLDVYRGWVYGFGFGFQLGLGVATVVTSSAVYASLVGAFLVASPGRSAVVVATFAVARAATLLSVARVKRPDQLLAMGRRLSRLDSWSRSAGLVAQLVAVLIAAFAVTGLR